MANRQIDDKSREVITLTAGEAEIMRVVWDVGEPVTVRDVYETLWDQRRKKGGRIAYTTVMSVMDKLALKKGILSQDRSGATYIYSATVTDFDLAESAVLQIVEKILGRSRTRRKSQE